MLILLSFIIAIYTIGFALIIHGLRHAVVVEATYDSITSQTPTLERRGDQSLDNA